MTKCFPSQTFAGGPSRLVTADGGMGRNIGWGVPESTWGQRDTHLNFFAIIREVHEVNIPVGWEHGQFSQLVGIFVFLREGKGGRVR